MATVSIEASLDLALLIEREGDTITAQSTKTRDDSVMPFEPFGRLSRVRTGLCSAGDFGTCGIRNPSSRQYAIIAQGLAALLDEAGGSLSQTALRQAIQDVHGCVRQHRPAGHQVRRRARTDRSERPGRVPDSADPVPHGDARDRAMQGRGL